jgi:hypothetical protein
LSLTSNRTLSLELKFRSSFRGNSIDGARRGTRWNGQLPEHLDAVGVDVGIAVLAVGEHDPVTVHIPS